MTTEIGGQLEFFVGLERGVWDALVRGDVDADRAALADDFLGVYPTGFAGADEHADQLGEGPTVAEFGIEQERLLVISDDHVMLSYLASYRRPGETAHERMYVSSLWTSDGGHWRNVFSQDTPVGGPVV